MALGRKARATEPIGVAIWTGYAEVAQGRLGRKHISRQIFTRYRLNRSAGAPAQAKTIEGGPG